ncbi:MAG: HAD family phosphatase [Chloroflexi bacterium]|nr:HAD family phosphatase [Chloroflexota bacterium]MCI0577997.1 HAD family phosphatase [Chloroflexota bacterium]MCI0646974.1 HAD family phosphatase [Chloroflexota bacterium]MCI0729267.1 HAD family phosphatase [Chloroflexota bacterium]
MDIKAIIFDFGQVINAPPDPESDNLRRARLAQRLGLSPDDLWPYLFEGEAAGQWMTGNLETDEFWRQVLAPRGLTDPQEIIAFAEEIFAEARQPNPEMVALLHELKGAYKLALLSNATWTEEEMRAMLAEEYGLPQDLFDVVVTSTSAGVVKPNPRIFRLALERLGVRPEEAIFTDDLASFTAAAARLGLHTFTFTTPAGLRRYLVEMGVLSG